MKRKSKELAANLKEAISKVEEIKSLTELAQKEENDFLEATRLEIENLAKEKGFFCGAKLNFPDIVSIVDMALKTGEAVTIPFNLYFIND